MRLVDTRSLQLVEVAEAKEPYAILSHRWESGEVSFQDLQIPGRREKQAGFRKIERACKQALDDGIGFVWVDTCCIDKASSAELSEAINSMFNWYQKAAVCYAYLSDTDDLGPSFSKSKWYTRGWTLQELLASPRVILLKELALILRGEAPLQQVSIAKRMSWAARRETTRPEDMAYCLMGIFDVNMPMLYGEGAKAFIRLQEEILRNSEDQSLFAWTASQESANQAPYRGLFASSPAEFASSFDVESFPRRRAFQTPMAPTNRGIPFTSILTYVSPSPALGSTASVSRKLRMGLNCHRHGDEDGILGIELISRGGDQYLRACPDRLFESRNLGTTVTVYVAKYAASDKIEPVHDAERQHAFYFSNLPPEIRVKHMYTKIHSGDFLDQPNILLLGDWAHHKAVLELIAPSEWTREAVLIVLWAVRIESIQSYKTLFDVVLTPKELVYSRVSELKKPGALFDERVISSGTGKLSLAFSIEPTVVRGFNMFSIKVEVRQPRTNFERNKVARWSTFPASSSRVESTP